MDPERWRQINETFHSALELEPAARSRLLERVGANDQALRSEVEALIRQHLQAGRFLEDPVLAASRPPSPDALRAGETVGRYTVVREIARGGMGTVYLAERSDEQYRQQVAVKLIRSGLDTEFFVERFYRERQILASLTHPGICRLLDGGTTSEGRPYLVMEYIDGAPIDAFCTRHGLPVDARIELFGKVCAAVHAAHQNLIIHRDLKPSNILVTADGEPKLLDFGTAKLLEPEPGAVGVAPTAVGLRLMTPRYASPEQVRGETVTTASDVYALGVVLYELLTGRRPFFIDSRLTPADVSAVCEETPAVPSLAVSRGPDGNTPAGRRLARELRGDIDTLVMMAMRKEPNRRYPSAAAFGEDLARYRAGLPVVAQRDTWRYRARKFVGRHRVAVAAATVALLSSSVGVAATLWQARVALRERARAERHLAEAREEQRRSEDVARLFVDLFEVADPNRTQGRTLTAREALDRGAEAIAGLEGQPARQAMLTFTIATAYRKLQLQEQALPQFRRALEVRRRTLTAPHVDLAAAEHALGKLLLDMERFAEAEPHLLTARAQYEVLAESGDRDLAAGLADAVDDLGRLALALGDAVTAETLARQGLELRRSLFGPVHAAVAESLNNVAWVLLETGRTARATPLFEQALSLRISLFGEVHTEVITSLNNLASSLLQEGRAAEARPRFERALALDRRLFSRDHPRRGQLLANLAATSLALGEWNLSRERFTEALAVQREVLEEGHPSLGVTLSGLAGALARTGDPEGASREYRRAHSLLREALGEDHVETVRALRNQARFLYGQRDYAAAEPVLSELLAIEARQHDPGDPALAETLRKLGRSMTQLGRPAAGRPHLERALAIQRAARSAGDPAIASAAGALGECLSLLGEYAAAEPLLVESLAIFRAERGDESSITKTAAQRLIELYAAWNRPRDADPYRALAGG